MVSISLKSSDPTLVVRLSILSVRIILQKGKPDVSSSTLKGLRMRSSSRRALIKFSRLCFGRSLGIQRCEATNLKSAARSSLSVFAGTLSNPSCFRFSKSSSTAVSLSDNCAVPPPISVVVLSNRFCFSSLLSRFAYAISNIRFVSIIRFFRRAHSRISPFNRPISVSNLLMAECTRCSSAPSLSFSSFSYQRFDQTCLSSHHVCFVILRSSAFPRICRNGNPSIASWSRDFLSLVSWPSFESLIKSRNSHFAEPKYRDVPVV